MKLEAREIIHRGKPLWLVDIPASRTGKRRKVYRQSKADALNAARALLDEHEHHRGEMASLTVFERNFILRWRGRLDLEEMEDACAAAWARSSVTVEEAVTRYLAAPREAPLSVEYLGSLRPRLNRFKREFTGRSLSTLTAGELQAFIRSQGASSTSYFSNLRSLFRHARLNEWVTKNPMEYVPRPEPEQAEKGVFTPEQMKAMLKWCAANDWRLLRYVVLCGFCWLRHTEALRLLPSDISETWELHIRRMKTRKRGIRERYVQALPLAVDWLKLTTLLRHDPRSKTYVGMNDKNLREHRAEMLKAVGFSWIGNGLRRSCASYDLAATQDAATTAERLGHTDAETTKAKYRVPRNQAIGVEWFSLTPEAVLR